MAEAYEVQTIVGGTSMLAAPPSFTRYSTSVLFPEASWRKDGDAAATLEAFENRICTQLRADRMLTLTYSGAVSSRHLSEIRSGVSEIASHRRVFRASS